MISSLPSTPAPIWPALPLAAWQDTCTTLHMWTQIIGKTRLALAAEENHWWRTTLYVTERGLTTSPMPCDGPHAHGRLRFHRPLPRHANPRPVEVETAIPFAEDVQHASYDAEAVNRWWRVLVQVDRVLKRFRGGFAGKQSPVHFFWGSFDLAVTRFSGRPAPRHAGGAPNCPDYVMVEAYSHACSSAGFWPGGDPVGEPAFYAYAYPAPPGYSAHAMAPAEAYYHPQAREFILPYEAVRLAVDPDAALLAFLEASYEAAAQLGRWDRRTLERRSAQGT